jgi:hypothetical protein
MSEENPNVGKQFKDIMGANFSPEDTLKMQLNAQFGEEHESSSEIERETNALSRFHDFPSNMIHYNQDDGYHVRLTTPRGWTHVWSGGPYISHQSSPGVTEHQTNMHDYAENSDNQSYSKGISLATFLGHVNSFEETAEEDFPKDHKPDDPR